MSAPALTPVVVRLKLSLLRNGLRQSGGRKAAYIASAVFALLFAVLQLLGLIALRGHAHVEALAVLAVAVLGLGWAVMPLFFPSGDETLDPTRLVMLPLRPRPLVRALLTASLVGIGPLFTLCLLVGSVIAVARGGAAFAVGVVAVALALLVCVAFARAVAAANVRLLTSRKGRDLAVLSGLVIAVGAQIVNFGAQRLGSAGLGELDPVADVLQWVPCIGDRRRARGGRGVVRSRRRPTGTDRLRAGGAGRGVDAASDPADDLARRVHAAQCRVGSTASGPRPGSRGCCPPGARARSWSAACDMCGATPRPRPPG